jgi:hypothetical protein
LDIDQFPGLFWLINLIPHQRFQVGIGDSLFLVCQILETLENVVQFLTIQVKAHLLQLATQGMATAVLAQYQ